MHHPRDLSFSYEGFVRAKQNHFLVVAGGDDDPMGAVPVVVLLQSLESDPHGRRLWLSAHTVLSASRVSLGAFLLQGMTFMSTLRQRTGIQVGRLSIYQFAPRRAGDGLLAQEHMHVTHLEYGSVRELAFDLDARKDGFHRERVRLGRVHIEPRRPAGVHELEFLARAEQRHPWPREDWGEPAPPPRPTQREIPPVRDTDAPPPSFVGEP